MANDKARTDLAEKIAKHADLSVNAVLRVFYALADLDIDVTNSTVPSGEAAVTRAPLGTTSGKKGK